MANEYRNESRRRAPIDRYGTPGTQYPTPNPFDVVITEEVPIRTARFDPVIYGTPHPKVPSARLCYQGPTKGNNTDKSVLRIYATPRYAQETYNLQSDADESNNPSYPTFTRSYLVPREYSGVGTIGIPLTSLVRIVIQGSGGSGYGASLPSPGNGQIPLVFDYSGGSGGGNAAGYAEVVGGAVVAAVLTNTGGGFVYPPSVSVSGGTGASLYVYLQPSSALLTSQIVQPAEDPFGGYFVRVTCTYETIPGPPITSTKYDAESDVLITTTRRKKLLSSITPGYAESGSSVSITEAEPIDAMFGWEVVTVIPNSPHNSEGNAIIEQAMLPFQFPGRIDIGMLDLYGEAIGHKTPASETVLHTTKTWWEISVSPPTVTFDELTPDDIVINDVTYRQVLHDAATRIYNGSFLTIPATVPSYSDYLATWVGQAKVIRGGFTRAGHAYRWKVQSTSVVMR